ncbi:MAG: AraC family transcriptional regulator, partial [Bacteroidota bacterium]
MKTRLHTADLDELLAEVNYPTGFVTPDGAIIERNYASLGRLGTGSYRELFFDGIHIGYGDITLHQPTEILLESDFETVEMHFTLCGNMLTYNHDTRTSTELSS